MQSIKCSKCNEIQPYFYLIEKKERKNAIEYYSANKIINAYLIKLINILDFPKIKNYRIRICLPILYINDSIKDKAKYLQIRKYLIKFIYSNLIMYIEKKKFF